MAAVPLDYLFVVNHRAATWPFVGLVIRTAGYLVVDRTKLADRRACGATMTQTLRAGRSILVFPEGTIPRNGRALPFQPGAFSAAIAAGRPIVPITIRGTDTVWPRDAWTLRRGALDVVVHEPIAPGEASRREIFRLSEAAREQLTPYSRAGSHHVE